MSKPCHRPRSHGSKGVRWWKKRRWDRTGNSGCNWCHYVLMEARLSMQNLSQVLGTKQAHPAGTLFAVLSVALNIDLNRVMTTLAYWRTGKLWKIHATSINSKFQTPIPTKGDLLMIIGRRQCQTVPSCSMVMALVRQMTGTGTRVATEGDKMRQAWGPILEYKSDVTHAVTKSVLEA